MQKPKIIRFTELKDITGVTRSTISRWEKAGRFPRRIKVGNNTVGWHLHEVNEWLDTRPRGFLTIASKAKHHRQRKKL